MCKSGTCDTKPAISLKRSSLEPNLLQSVYRNSCTAYRLVTNLATSGVNFGLLFQAATFFHNGYLAHFFVRAQRNLATLGVWPINSLIPRTL